MKKTIITLGVAGIMLSSNAANITFSNLDTDGGNFRPFADSSNNLIPNGGGFAAVGYFTLDDAAITGASSVGFLASDFQEFGSTTFGGSAAFNADGYFKAELFNGINSGDGFDGENIFAVIGNGTSLLGSTELSIVRSDTLFAFDDPLFSYTFNLATESGTALLGQVGPTTSTAAGSFPTFQTAAVPEPSTYATIAGLLALSWVMTRRRK